MEFPKYVHIGPHTYTIELTSEKIKDDDGRSLAGQANHRHDTIKISTKQSESRQFETFIHEILHAICESNYIPLREKDVERLGLGLAVSLKDNLSLDWTVEEAE